MVKQKSKKKARKKVRKKCTRKERLSPYSVLKSPDSIAMVFSLPALFFLAYIGPLFELGGLWFYCVVMAVAVILLISASERFLHGAKGLARCAGIPEIVIGLTIVSIGTSLPEIASTSMASYQAYVKSDPGLSDFAIGNIYGSVLVQITFVLGLVVLVRPMIINRGSVKRDGIAMIAGTSLLTFMIILDSVLGRIEAIILIMLYIGYIIYLVKNKEKIRKEEEDLLDEDEDYFRFPSWAYLIMVFIGMTLVIYASEWLVTAASEIAKSLGVGEGIIGLTVSAVGTSLPELAIALVAIKSARGLAIGTLIGSNVTDPMFSVGIAGVINPIALSAGSEALFLTIIAPYTLVACILAMVFMWSDWEIERWEGAVLVVCYIAFVPLVLYFM
jgi:cation:H+ antiporter